jgi:uncharacterized membrane protein YraQ (UPF0718 family)
MMQLSLFITLAISLFLQALPGLVMGVVVSSSFLVFVDQQWWLTRLPRNRVLTALLGSSLGMVLPVPQYGTIPVVRRWLGQGVPLPLAIAYLVAAPTLNPFALWSSLQTFASYPKLSFIRTIFIWLLGGSLGILFSLAAKDISLLSLSKPSEGLSPLTLTGTAIAREESDHPLQRSGNLIYEYAPVLPRSWWRRWLLFGDNGGRELLELGGILLLTSAIAALVQMLLPMDSLFNWAQSPLRQLLVMFGLGIVSSAGAIANTPFASLWISNFLMGSLLALLLASSFLNFQSIGLLFNAFHPKVAGYLLLLFALATFLLTLCLNFYGN